MLIFGWVSSNIQSNWANWSSWKDTGSQENADEFWNNTHFAAEAQGLTWFCYNLED